MPKRKLLPPNSVFRKIKGNKDRTTPFNWYGYSAAITGITPLQVEGGGNYQGRGNTRQNSVENTLKTKQAPQGNVIKWLL